MATSQTSPTPVDHTDPLERPSPRLTLCPTLGRGPLDGAWWPRSRDLASELADLVDILPESAGPVVHTTVSPPDWDGLTRDIQREHGRLRVDSFPRDDTHVVLLGTRTTMLIVMVIPPETPPPQAHAALRWGASSENTQPATDLLRSLADADPVEDYAQPPSVRLARIAAMGGIRAATRDITTAAVVE
jgi:hypothetical protein